MWEKKTIAIGGGASADDLHDVNNTYSWCAAKGSSTGVCAGNTISWIDQVNAEIFAGFSDWRVPTRDELLGIVDCSSGAICGHPIFGPTLVEFHWSSTEVDAAFAWYLNVFNGVAASEFKLFTFAVRAVRVSP